MDQPELRDDEEGHQVAGQFRPVHVEGMPQGGRRVRVAIEQSFAGICSWRTSSVRAIATTPSVKARRRPMPGMVSSLAVRPKIGTVFQLGGRCLADRGTWRAPWRPSGSHDGVNSVGRDVHACAVKSD